MPYIRSIVRYIPYTRRTFRSLFVGSDANHAPIKTVVLDKGIWYEKTGYDPYTNKGEFGLPWYYPACALLGQEERQGVESYKVIVAEKYSCYLFWIPLEGIT